MFGLFLMPIFQGISSENMAKNMVLMCLHFRFQVYDDLMGFKCIHKIGDGLVCIQIHLKSFAR